MLTRHANAVQIGLTATPRQIDCHEETQEARADAAVTKDNVKYFGEPVYEYGLAQAMDDGYLAACEIQMAQVNLDATGLTAADIVARNPRNAITGQSLTAAEIAAVYEKTDYEAKLLLPDRVNAMCLDLFTRLLASDPQRGPHQKTIVTGGTRLFGMPFVSPPKGPEPPGPGPGGPEPPPPPPPIPQVIVDGFEVSLNDLGQYIVAPVGGVAMPVVIDDYKAGLSAKLVAECTTLEAFRARWVNPPDREEIIEMIVGSGYSPS